MMASKADDFQISQYRIDAFRPYTGDSVASSNGATWAHGRAILRSSFAKAQVSNFDIYERHFQELVANIPTNGSTVDLKVLFSRLTLDVATEIIFGESINSLQSDAPQSTRDIDEAFDLATQGVGDRLRLGPFMFFHRDPKFKRAIGILDKYTGAIIEKALREMEFAKRRAKDIESRGKVVFLNELIKDTSDEKRIRDLLLNALLGGRDTTMALLSHAFINLSQNKEALKQLQAEISQLEGLAPTYEQIKDLKYLRWVIDESK
jgi:cytochrome P450